MDEIRKIPPVTRYMLGATGAVTLPCILAITSPWRFALSWQLVIYKFHVHRVFTSFFYGGSGLKLLFDVFLLYRNSSDLELNHFGRRTADYTWSLLVMGTLILAANYPLGAPIFFTPLLNALVNASSGATWVSIHHGGGVGIGRSIHAGQVVVADGTPLAAEKLARVLSNDPAMGVIRHADAGYGEAIEVADRLGVRIPMREGEQ